MIRKSCQLCQTILKGDETSPPPSAIRGASTFSTHGVLDFEFGRKKLSPQVTTDSDTVFREESIGEGFKIVTVAVFEKILLFENKIGSSLTAIFKPIRVVTKFLVK